MNYDSFGDGAGSALTRYGYTGRERDAETGLYYYRARWYDPQAGRFISEDPIGFEDGVNWYAYVENNPIRFTDPLGLAPCQPQSSREERCLRAIEDARRIKDEINKTIAKSLAYPGGFDQGHVDKVINKKVGLEDALKRIEQNCNNHEKKKFSKEIEGFRETVNASNPKVGDKLPIQEMKITAAALNVLGAIGSGARTVWQWVFAQ